MTRHALAASLLCASCARVSAEAQWQRSGRSLLTNFNNMYNPCVVETGGEFRYRMWFFGWAASHTNRNVPGCDAIFHARSRDLVSWEVYSGEHGWDSTMDPRLWVPVLHASDRWYEAWHVGDPSVVMRDGRFYMAYSATSKHFGRRAGYPSTMVQCLMGAVSDDGIRWKKTDRPLLIRAGDTADPKPEPGRIGDFHRPSLHWDAGRWRLWFDYWLPGKGVCMGYAENEGDFIRPGGFEIKHDLRAPLIANWPNPEIVRVGETYHSFSDPPRLPDREGRVALEELSAPRGRVARRHELAGARLHPARRRHRRLPRAAGPGHHRGETALALSLLRHSGRLRQERRPLPLPVRPYPSDEAPDRQRRVVLRRPSMACMALWLSASQAHAPPHGVAKRPG